MFGMFCDKVLVLCNTERLKLDLSHCESSNDAFMINCMTVFFAFHLNYFPSAMRIYALKMSTLKSLISFGDTK